jgi:acetolactate synthase-1/3 small subunit
LINVIDVQDVTDAPCVVRETALIKVMADATQRGQVLDVAEMYRARIADVGTETLIIEVTGEHDKIESIVEVLKPFGILEIMRTGKLAMTRGTVKPRPDGQQAVVTANGKHQPVTK